MICKMFSNLKFLKDFSYIKHTTHTYIIISLKIMEFFEKLLNHPIYIPQKCTLIQN